MNPIKKIAKVIRSTASLLKNGTNQIQLLQRQQAELVAKFEEQLQQEKETAREQRETAQQQREEVQLLRRELTAQLNLLEEAGAKNRNEEWMAKFGYDGLISNLQLFLVEQQVPGNRARLQALRDTHKGQKCFIIGNGPSLSAEDLTKLHENNVFCFGSKRINRIFDATPWRPDVWGVSDLNFLSLYHDEISELSGFVKLVPCQSIINLNVPITNAIYFPFIQAERNPCWFNADVERGVHFWGTITCKLINMAVYMGFTQIYLLGVDNSTPLIVGENGEKKYDTSKVSHFSKDYYNSEEDKQTAVKDITDVEHIVNYVNQAYKDVKWHCDQMGVEIYNATHGGLLETYPRVEFDQLTL